MLRERRHVHEKGNKPSGRSGNRCRASKLNSCWIKPETFYNMRMKDQWIRNRIEMAGAKEINFAREGKVLRVLPSGRWVPRNQGWLNFWETRLVTVNQMTAPQEMTLMSRWIRNTNRKRNYFESQEIKTPRFLWRCRITELNMEKECISYPRALIKGLLWHLHVGSSSNQSWASKLSKDSSLGRKLRDIKIK